NPEYFTLINGLRTVVGRRGHLCFSNPGVRELIYKHILEQCDLGYDIVELGQNDGFTPCQCKNCFELYDIKPTTVPEDGLAWLTDRAWGEKIWRMHLEFAERLKKDRPGKKVMISAYGACHRPPQGIKSFPESAAVYIKSQDSFKAWEEIDVPGGFGIINYVWGNYQVPGYTPLRDISYIRKQSERFVKNGVHTVQLDGKPIFEYGLEGPNIYAYLRLGMYPDLKNADELFNEYIDCAYLEANIPMRRFFVELQKSTALWGIVKNYIGEMGRDPIRALSIMYTPEIINKLENELAAAEKNAQQENVKKRLGSVRLEFDYLKDILNVIFAQHHFHAVGTAESFNRLLDLIEIRNTNLKKSPRTAKLKTNGRYMGIAPFNWDVKAMRKKGPAALVDKTFEAHLSSEKVTLDSEIWNKVKAQKLHNTERRNCKFTTDTAFKVIYDNNNIYIRVTGKQKGKLKSFAARGRDSDIWLAESIVFQLSPTGDKSRYYYFSYDNVENSFAEASHGFVTDTLDPRYGWNDWHWNGAWKYETTVKDNTWDSLAVIPLKSINAELPDNSSEWAFNIGRIHFSESGEREFSAWNRKLNQSYIPGDAFMGKLIFKKDNK
ncbi:MAG: DUF4838 domain-containing protein, partial [Planctomycetota bacterium]